MAMFDFKSQLAQIFQKYPFIHVDKTGELSIIIPLTGARKITDNFSESNDKPTALYLFGDNTCKSDLERRAFFYGKKEDVSTSFKIQFPKLIEELKALGSNSNSSISNQKLIQSILRDLAEFNEEVNAFQKNNPGYGEMKSDLKLNDQIFVSNAEFLVKVPPDSLRLLALPNVMSLGNFAEFSTQKMIPEDLRKDCLSTLSLISEPQKSDGSSLIPEAIKHILNITDYLSRKDNKSPKELFKIIYQNLQKQDDSLKDLTPDVFEDMQLNLFYICSEDEDFSTWSDVEVTDVVAGLFKNANLLNSSKRSTINSFATLYQNASNRHNERFQNSDNTLVKFKETYQLFILQTFLYLCVIELRVKNKDSAHSIINIFQDKEALKNLLVMLCTDEASFRTMMADKFQLSATEYQLIIDASNEILADHLEAEHFDELRTACVSESVQNSHYLIMGGRLCWSAAPITEMGNIKNVNQQSQVSALHFETFYSQRQNYIKSSVAFQRVQDLLKSNLMDEQIHKECLTHIGSLSQNQKEKLLIRNISTRNYRGVQFLIKHGSIDCSPRAFILVLKQIPLPSNLLKLFLATDPKYAQYIEGEHLIQAVVNGEFEHVKLILKHRPDLLEYEDRLKQTPFLLACKKGHIDLAKYLMDSGANIHSRTIVPLDHVYSRGVTPYGGKTAKQWVEDLHKHDPIKSAMLLSLYDEYYKRIENNFKTNPAYKNNFTIHSLNRAINNGDLELIDLFIKYCPHLAKHVGESELKQAKKQHDQHNLRAQIIPYQEQFNELLEGLQTKLEELALRNEGHYDEINHTINKLNVSLTKARNLFFNNEITPESFQKFNSKCKKALQNASPILAMHRGWHNVPDFIRAVVGVLAGIAIIPALVIEYTAKNGYIGVFFDKKENVETDSINKLNQFEEHLEPLKSEIEIKLNR